ncbi:MAG: DNA mismatch repair protein MutS, partial [Bacteroidota bacterium]
MPKTAKKTTKKKKVTPLMEQYFSTKAKYPDAILLFRVGDFYETFGEDAITASQVLGIILTKRNNGGSDIELAGFPHHSLNLYLPKLVRAGFRVAICEQLEKPSKEKKIVKRGVTEVVTPGVAIDETLLDHAKNNYLCAIHNGSEIQGIAFLDISTGEFLVSEGSAELIDKLIQSFNPSEILYARSEKKWIEKQIGNKQLGFKLDDWVFSSEYGTEQLSQHFEVQNFKGFGIDSLKHAQIAAGAVLHYLASTENKQLEHINTIQRIQSESFVWLDRFSIRNLELLSSPHDDGVALINILDETISPMGSRLMRKWVIMPLVNLQLIAQRHEMVQYFLDQSSFTEEIENQIKLIGDLERLISKVSLGKIAPRELIQLKKALFAIMPIRQLSMSSECEGLKLLADSLHLCETARDRIKNEINDDAPVAINKGNVIKEGVSETLDEYRNIVSNSKALLLEIQEKEAEKTGIKNLKIGFNNVFGYYLEVTNKYKN